MPIAKVPVSRSTQVGMVEYFVHRAANGTPRLAFTFFFRRKFRRAENILRILSRAAYLRHPSEEVQHMVVFRASSPVASWPLAFGPQWATNASAKLSCIASKTLTQHMLHCRARVSLGAISNEWKCAGKGFRQLLQQL